MGKYIHRYNTVSGFQQDYVLSLDIESVTVLINDGNDEQPYTFDYLTATTVSMSGNQMDAVVYRCPELGGDLVVSASSNVYDVFGENSYAADSSATYTYTEFGHASNFYVSSCTFSGAGAYLEPWLSYINENEKVNYNIGHNIRLNVEFVSGASSHVNLSIASKSEGFISTMFSSIDDILFENFQDILLTEKLTVSFSDGKPDQVLPYIMQGTWTEWDNNLQQDVQKEGWLAPTFLSQTIYNQQSPDNYFDEIWYSWPSSNQYYTNYYGYKYEPVGRTPWCCQFIVDDDLLSGPCNQ